MSRPVEFAPDLRAAVVEHEGVYRRDFGRHPGWNTLDLVQKRRLKGLNVVVKLPKTADRDRDPRDKPNADWIRVPLPHSVANYVDQLDAVKNGGRISIFENEAEPQVYSHSLITEAFVRAAKPDKALLSHGKRGAQMLSSRRFQDAAYDLQYAEGLAVRLGLTVREVRGQSNETLKNLRDVLGDISGRFGYALMTLGNYEQARPRFVAALAYNPRQPYMNHNLGGCLRLLGEPKEQVAKYYARELRLNPAHPSAAEDLANLRIL